MPQRINDNFRTLAAGGLPFAAGLAAGLGPVKSALGAIATIGIDKLLGPSAALAAIFLGISRTILGIVRGTDLWAEGINRLARLENVESQFATIYKNVDRAKQKMRELAQFSLGTPFKMDSVLEAARSLEVLTRGAFAGSNALRTVGDVAAATSTSIEETSFWIGKLFNFLQTGRSVRNILFQMQSLGIITGELQNKLESLEDTGASFAQKWGVVTTELSRAQGGMEANMQTLDGLRSRLESVRAQMATGFADPFLNLEKESIYGTIRMMQAISPALRLIAQDSALVRGATEHVRLGIKGMAAEALQTTGILEKMWKAFTVLAPTAIMSAGVTLIASLGRIAVGRGSTRALMQGGQESLRAIAFRTRGVGEFDRARVAERVVQMRDFRATRARSQMGSALQTGALFEAGARGAEFVFNRAMGVAARANAAGMAALAQATEKATAEAIKHGLTGAAVGQAVSAATRNVRSQATAVSLLGAAWRGTVRVVGTVVTAMSRMFRVLALGGGVWGWIIRGVGLFTMSLWRLGTDMSRTAKEAEKLSKATQQVGQSLREQIAAIRTAEDRAVALAKAYEALAEAEAMVGKTKPGTTERQEAETRALTARSNIRIIENIGEAGLVPNETEMERRVSQRFFREVQAPLLEAEAIGQQGTDAARVISLREQLRVLREQKKFADDIETAQKTFSGTKEGKSLADLQAQLANVANFDPLKPEREAAEARLAQAQETLRTAEEAINANANAQGGRDATYGTREEQAAYQNAKQAVAAAEIVVDRIIKAANDESPEAQERRAEQRKELAEDLRRQIVPLEAKSPIAAQRLAAEAQILYGAASSATKVGMPREAERLRQKAGAKEEQSRIEARKFQAGQETPEQIKRIELDLTEAEARMRISRSELIAQRDLQNIKETGARAEIAAAGVRLEQAKRELAVTLLIPAVEQSRIDAARLRVREAEKELRIAKEIDRQGEATQYRVFEDERQGAQVEELMSRGETELAGTLAEQLNTQRREESIRQRLGEAFERGGEPEVTRERERIVQEEHARQREAFDTQTEARIGQAFAARNADAPAARKAFEAQQRERELIRSGVSPSEAREQAVRETGVQRFDESKLQQIAGTFKQDDRALAQVTADAYNVQRRPTPEEVVNKMAPKAESEVSRDAAAIVNELGAQTGLLREISGKLGGTVQAGAGSQAAKPYAGPTTQFTQDEQGRVTLAPPPPVGVPEQPDAQRQAERDRPRNTFQRPGEKPQEIPPPKPTVQEGTAKKAAPADPQTEALRSIDATLSANRAEHIAGQQLRLNPGVLDLQSSAVSPPPPTPAPREPAGRKLSAPERAAQGLNPGGFFTGTGGGPLAAEPEKEWKTGDDGVTRLVPKDDTVPGAKAPSAVSMATSPQATATSATDSMASELSAQTALLKEINGSLKNSAVLKLQ